MKVCLVACIAIALAACAGRANSSTTPQGDQAGGEATPAELSRRVAAIEARLDAMERSLLKMEQSTSDIAGQLGTLREATSQVAARVEELSQKAPVPPSQPRPSRPDPAAVYAVPVDGSPVRGPANAKVTMIIGMEFACPFCDRVQSTLDQLLADYGKELRIVYKSYLVHPEVARTPALAACAAHKQGKFVPMARAIFEKGFRANRNLSAENMERIARDIRLNLRTFRRDMQGAECSSRIDREQAQLAQVGMRGTPSFYINGRFLSGAQPIEAFRALIDEELAKANAAIAGGIKQSEYYEHLVATGKTKVDE